MSRIDKVYFYGNYAFALGAMSNGIYLLDITNPASTRIIKYINFPNSSYDMEIVGNNGYIVSGNRFCILDIDPPESTNIIKTLDNATGLYAKLDVLGEYAYVTDLVYNNVQIIDIEPPSSAAVVKTVATSNNTYDVDYSNGYACAVDSNGLEIIDVDPVGSASIIKNVPLNSPRSIFIKDNYAYFSCIHYGYYVVNIERPQYAFVEKTISTYYPYSSFVSGSYAYVADYLKFTIVDIYPLESAYIFRQMQPPNHAVNVIVDNGIAWVGNEYGEGLTILDLW